MPRRSTDPEFLVEISSKFKTALKKHGLTNKAAAELLGVTRQSLYLYKKGKVAPSTEILRRAMELWKIDLTFRNRKLAIEDLTVNVSSAQISTSESAQLNLWDAIKKLDSQSVRVEIHDKTDNVVELKLKISF